MSTIVTRTGKGSALTWAEADANFTNLNTDKAELASPTFTGVPSANTAVSGTNTTQLATTAFVQGKTATQTPFTATGNIVATNVQTAIAELDTEKVAKAGDTLTGPLRTPTSQIGTSATTTENHFWDGSVANQLSLKRGTPEAPGTELIQVLSGILSFPNQAQSLTGNGYIKLPGGLIVQWGTTTLNASPDVYSYPISFSNAVLVVIGSPIDTTTGLFAAFNNNGISTFAAVSRNAAGTAQPATVRWIALGY